jgi:hypothetical protein
MANQMNELADRWILPLRGSRVTGIDWGENIQFLLDPAGEITVGLGALLSHGAASAPGADVKTLSEFGQDAVQRCVGSVVLSAVGFKNGALRIVFDNGWHLNVRPGEPHVAAAVTFAGSAIWPRTEMRLPSSAS